MNALSATASAALTFFAFINPDGNATSAAAHLNDAASATFPAPDRIGAPDGWGADDIANLDAGTAGNLDHDIFALGALPDANDCAPICDVVAALQWDLGVLQPNEATLITVRYADHGTLWSDQFLTVERADGVGAPDYPATVLTVSGFSGLTSLVPGTGPLARLVLVGGLLVAGAVLGRRAGA